MLRGNNVNINFSASEPYFDIVDERTPIEVEVKLATEFRGPPQYKVSMEDTSKVRCSLSMSSHV